MELVLEARLFWFDTGLEVRSFPDQDVVTLGDEAGADRLGQMTPCDLSAPALELPLGRYPLCARRPGDPSRWDILFHRSMQGVRYRRDGSAEILTAGDAPGPLPGTCRVPLEPGEVCILAHGTSSPALRSFRIELRYVRRERLAVPPLASRLPYAWLNALLFSFFVGSLSLAALLSAKVGGGLGDDALILHPFRAGELRLVQQKPTKTAPLPEPMELHPNQNAPALTGAGAPRRSPKTPEVKAPGADRTIAKATLEQLFGGESARGRMFGTGQLSRGVEDTLGALTQRATAGNDDGIGGVTLRGEGPDGADRPVAVPLSDHYVPQGSGRGPREQLKKTQVEDCVGCGELDIRPRNVHLIGGLDKAEIRSVIDKNYEAVRFCYSYELVRTPSLAGKVRFEWVIDAEGAVRGLRVEEKSEGFEAVAACVAKKIAAWRFPKPRGGGEVVVHYPFVFNAH
ncbi:MAG: AgmX/PglI C-terminal domain-containing protein [Myxococcota bacterium]